MPLVTHGKSLHQTLGLNLASPSTLQGAVLSTAGAELPVPGLRLSTGLRQAEGVDRLTSPFLFAFRHPQLTAFYHLSVIAMCLEFG